MTKQPELPDNLFTARADELEGIFREAVRKALLFHKRMGNSIAVSENGKVVIIPPEEIDVEDPLDSKKPR